jgi:hypothetical protein
MAGGCCGKGIKKVISDLAENSGKARWRWITVVGDIQVPHKVLSD